MSFFRYVVAAFSAKPWGMFVAPNWIAVAAVALLGLENPGFWVVGAGLELGYLLALATNARFQRIVSARDASSSRAGGRRQVETLLARLDPSDSARYRQLEARCQKVLEQKPDEASLDLQLQTDGLNKLMFVYLRLLLTRTAIVQVLRGAATQSIDARMTDVRQQLEGAGTPELQHSLRDQLDILAERKKRHGEAQQKLQFIEAELVRIQEQVELIREGIAVSPEPATLSRKIDQVGETLGGTTQWIKEQQELLGQTEDLLGDDPPVLLEPPPRASQ